MFRNWIKKRTHAIRDCQLPQAQLLNQLSHQVYRHRTARRDACAQCVRIDLLARAASTLYLRKHTKEVRRYAMEGGASFVCERVYDGWRVEQLGRVHNRSAMRPGGEVAED